MSDPVFHTGDRIWLLFGDERIATATVARLRHTSYYGVEVEAIFDDDRQPAWCTLDQCEHMSAVDQLGDLALGAG